MKPCHYPIDSAPKDGTRLILWANMGMMGHDWHVASWDTLQGGWFDTVTQNRLDCPTRWGYLPLLAALPAQTDPAPPDSLHGSDKTTARYIVALATEKAITARQERALSDIANCATLACLDNPAACRALAQATLDKIHDRW